MRGLLATVSLAAVCTMAPSIAQAQEVVSDPWEGFNRDMFAVHEAADKSVLEPIARGYRWITPQPIRTGINNFLRNLRSPVVFTNDVLQGEFKRAGTTAVRFGLNTTVGVFGVLDPATPLGFERHDEDFGQTLAVWGVDSGPYLFIPLIGPTTVRDGTGRIIDIIIDPLTWAHFDGDDIATPGRSILAALSAREGVLDAMDDLRQDSVDPYVSIRTSYGLWRYSAIQNGRHDVQDLPEFEAIPDEVAPDMTTPGVTTPDTTSPDAGGNPQTSSIQDLDPTVSLAQIDPALSSPGDQQ